MNITSDFDDIIMFVLCYPLQQTHWPCVRLLERTVGLSALEALSIEHDESETVNAMAGLSMQSLHR